MKFLFDTNVISEGMRPQPDKRVQSWLSGIDTVNSFLSVVSLAEIRFGILRMAEGRRKAKFEEWFENVVKVDFQDRIIASDPTVAEAWADISVRGVSQGRAIDVIDAFIAATAVVHDLTLATRNTKVFEGSVPKLFNPWADAVP